MNEFAKKLAIGTAQFGIPYGISNQTGKVPDDEITAILDHAWETGVNTLDTAKAYGDSEILIGKYLTNRPQNSWTIITKLAKAETSVSNICMSIMKLKLVWV